MYASLPMEFIFNVFFLALNPKSDNTYASRTRLLYFIHIVFTNIAVIVLFSLFVLFLHTRGIKRNIHQRTLRMRKCAY